MTSSLKPFLILYYIKQIDSKLLCICSVINHRQNVVRTSVPLFCSYHILSVIYYWTDARQLGIYLLNRVKLCVACSKLTTDYQPHINICTIQYQTYLPVRSDQVSQDLAAKLKFKFKTSPLTPISDQGRISPNNINTILSRQVMRIKKNIN